MTEKKKTEPEETPAELSQGDRLEVNLRNLFEAHNRLGQQVQAMTAAMNQAAVAIEQLNNTYVRQRDRLKKENGTCCDLCLKSSSFEPVLTMPVDEMDGMEVCADCLVEIREALKDRQP